VPYNQNLVQIVGDAAYLYFTYTHPRISTNKEHATKLQKTDARPKRYVTNQFIVLYEKLQLSSKGLFRTENIFQTNF